MTLPTDSSNFKLDLPLVLCTPCFGFRMEVVSVFAALHDGPPSSILTFFCVLLGVLRLTSGYRMQTTSLASWVNLSTTSDDPGDQELEA